MEKSDSPDATATVLETLNRLRAARGLSYRDIATRLDVSELTVKRYFTGRRLTLDRLERLCGILEIELFDLIDFTRPSHSSVSLLDWFRQTNLHRDS
jgi:transcriptional regulator with XRE-family HTH domain